MTKLVHPKPFSGFDASKNYLVLVSAEKIPHLVLVSKNLYYSLTYKEAELGKDAVHYLDLFERLNKTLLVFELNAEISDVKQTFSTCISADTNNTTCFVPVKRLLAPDSQAEMIFQLIPELLKNKRINNCYHLRLENYLTDTGGFELRTYTKEMIFLYIQQLKDKDARRK
jgi:hypothetical protein